MGIQNSITNKCDSLNVTTTATIGTGATVTTGNVEVNSGNAHITSVSNDTVPPFINFYKSRSGGIVQDGDSLGSFKWLGYDGSSYIEAARIEATVNGTVSSSILPTDISFYTSQGSTPRVVATIDSTGCLTFKNTTGSFSLIGTDAKPMYIGNFSLGVRNAGLYFSNACRLSVHSDSSAASLHWGYFGTKIPDLGDNTIAIGNNIAQGSSTLTSCIALGYNALGSPNSNTTGAIAIGNESMRYGSCSSSTTGSIAIGTKAGLYLRANNCIAIGNESLMGSTGITGQYNIAIGDYALSISNGSGVTWNTGVGVYSLYRINSTSNVGLGAYSGASYAGNAAYNVFLGYQAGYRGDTTYPSGSYNVFLGCYTGTNYSSTESSNILIGGEVAGTNGESNVLRIGKATGTGSYELDKAFICGIYGVSVGTTAGVAIVDSSNQIGTLSGTSGQVFMGGTKPAFSTTTYPSTTSQGDILYSSADNTISALAKNTSSTRYLSNTGSDNNPAWAQVNLANGVTGVLPPANGGAIIWEEVTGTTKTMEVSHAYIANNGSQVVFTLPSTSALGTIITVQGYGAGEWKIEQNADQQIHVAGSSTTPGTDGYVESGARYDSITLVCVVADDIWVATSYIGTLTVV